MNKIFTLFKTFFIIGAFTIGGGYAMLPLFEEEFVNKKKWFTDEDYIDMLTIISSAPGPLAVNSAVYTGYHVAGFWGSFFSVIGVIIAPLTIIIILAPLYEQFRGIDVIDKIFKGVRPAVVGLIISAVYKLSKGTQLKGYWFILPIISFIAIVFLKIDTIIVIIILGFCGFFKYLFNKGENND